MITKSESLRYLSQSLCFDGNSCRRQSTPRIQLNSQYCCWMLSLTAKDLRCLQNNWCIMLDTLTLEYPTLQFRLCSRQSLTCVWHRTIGELKLEVDTVFVVFIYIFFYQTVNTALSIAGFVLVSCQITIFFSHNAVPLNQGQKYNCCWICHLCVQGYKAEGLLSNYKYWNLSVNVLHIYLIGAWNWFEVGWKETSVLKSKPRGESSWSFFFFLFGLRLTFS